MDKGSIIRTIVLFVALVNQVLVMMGYSPLPFGEAEVEMFVSTLFTVIASLVAWWKNNYLSEKGKRQKEALKRVGLTKSK